MFQRFANRTLVAYAALVAPAVLAGCSSSHSSTSSSQGGTAHGAVASAPPLAAPSSPPAGGVRITTAIDESKRVTLVGNTAPPLKPSGDLGAVDDARILSGMQLVLKRSPAAETELDTLLEAMYTPRSPSFHKWLTAADFGARFGVAEGDIAILKQWLESHGFRVDGVPAGRMLIAFTGTAAQVREAFHTEIHKVSLSGAPHIASATDPEIPAALAGVVSGIHGLHDFGARPMRQRFGPVKRVGHSGYFQRSNPQFTCEFANDGGYNGECVGPDAGGAYPPNFGSNGSFLLVTPADLFSIYGFPGTFPGTGGAGQTVVVVEDGDILTSSDVTNFWSYLGVSTTRTFSQKNPQPPGGVTCTDPGVVAGVEDEAALDVEWAGAAAPGATIELDSCADGAVAGPVLAVQNLVNASNPPPIISMSYGACEAFNGAAANQNVVFTYQQGAAEGISIIVSSGDSASAGCDQLYGDSYATLGITSNGFGSTPYNLSAGGTDFLDVYDDIQGGPGIATYWNATNTSTEASALSYIPEIPWNDSCASSLLYRVEGATQAYGSGGFCNTTTGAGFLNVVGGGGGPSAFSAQPTWQTGVQGLPTQSGGMRYLPDIAMFAANGLWSHFLVSCMTDTSNHNAAGGSPCSVNEWNGGGGTSYVAPILAGIQAVLNQSTAGGVPQGNPAPMYYQIAASQYGLTGSSACNSGTAPSPAAPAPSCIFYDVTSGDNDVPCKGPNNCYGWSKTTYGILSPDGGPTPAFATNPGWDYPTGLGSLNVSNLVTAWSALVQ